MAYLEINGMTCRAAGLSEKEDGLRTFQRGVTGKAYKDVLEHKRAFDLALAVDTLEQADAWKRLLEGRGHTFAFQYSLYSAKGLPPKTGHTATFETSSPAPKYGDACVSTGLADLEYELVGYDAWTVSVWVWNGSSWELRQQTSDGTKLLDGVTGAYGWSLAPSGAGTLANKRTFTLDAGGYFDDLVILPFVMPTSLLQQWAAHTRAFSQLPYLELSGTATGGEIFEVGLDESGMSGEHVGLDATAHIRLSCGLRQR